MLFNGYRINESNFAIVVSEFEISLLQIKR
jgi:hypothetical protein